MQFHFPVLVIWPKSTALLASILENSDDNGNRKVIVKSKLIAFDNGILPLIIGERKNPLISQNTCDKHSSRTAMHLTQQFVLLSKGLEEP